ELGLVFSISFAFILRRRLMKVLSLPQQSLFFCVFCLFCLLGLAKEFTSAEGSFFPQWFLPFVYAVGCLLTG
ncbi:MAG TPA: hypothetical protein PKU87_05940, partial [Candidatus Atribacteria bacterium]|nr:hypothetical protein [Candidatus Atribacteria bacterium]